MPDNRVFNFLETTRILSQLGKLQKEFMSMEKVENLNHLKELAASANGDFVDFCILLAGGLTRSSKRIHYDLDSDEFCIIHEIDEAFQELSTNQLSTETNIIEAIEKNALYWA